MDVSLVICTHNRADQLRRALDRLLEMQTTREWEAIILDNASTDHTRQVVERYALANPSIRYAYEAEQGLGAARDTAWRLARGRLVSFTDDDCYIHPTFVDAVCKTFAACPHWGYLGGRIELHDSRHARVTIDERDKREEIAPAQFIRTGALHGANLTFRRDVLERIGGVGRDLGAGTPFPCEDIELIARAAWAGETGGFDPAPAVRHDHGRTEADVGALMDGYARGRAAYFAIFLGREDSRQAYVAGILHHLMKQSLPRALGLLRLYRAHGMKLLRARGHEDSARSLRPIYRELALARLGGGMKSRWRRLRSGDQVAGQ